MYLFVFFVIIVLETLETSSSAPGEGNLNKGVNPLDRLGWNLNHLESIPIFLFISYRSTYSLT
jgi:hypothetical protein